MGMMPNNPVIGGTILRRAGVQSPNYSKGSSGWAEFQDGSAEFNSMTLRGTFNGTNYVINADGEFRYSGTPAAGNLIYSDATQAGTDSYGNAYLAGSVSYVSGSPYAAVASDGGNFTFYTADSYAGPWNIVGAIDQGVPSGYTGLRFTVDDGTQHPAVYLMSDGTNSWFSAASGSVFAAPNPATGLPDGWNAVTLKTGWAAGGDFNSSTYTPAVKMLPDGSIAIRGALTTPSSTFSMPVEWGTAPSGYANTQNSPPTCPVVQGIGNHTGTIAIKSNGSLWLDGNFGTSEDIFLDGTLRIS